MRLKKIQDYMSAKGYPFQYFETDNCGSIEFDHRGLHYHIWEYPEPDPGAESNVASAGRSVEYSGDYEEEILAILKSWEGSWWWIPTSPISACTASLAWNCPGISPSTSAAKTRPSRP